MIDIVGGFNLIFEWFGQHMSTMLLIGGFFAGFYFIYWFFKGKQEEGEETPTLMKIMTYLGVLIGIILLGGGVNAWPKQGMAPYDYHWFTCVLAIIVGIALVLRPIKDIPWAALVGVIVGGFVVFISATYLKVITDGFASILGIDPYWILIITFLIIFLIVFLAFKMIEGIGKLLGAALSSRPASLIIMIICATEAILIYITGQSLGLLLFG
ncbi:MAG: hypothetical protein HWN65_00960 [Candidatus Helarchaeota archaeon]|nr:hypothetical protein [Candidatus Helarchaeota archaeon]